MKPRSPSLETRSLPERVARHAATAPEHVALRFLVDGDEPGPDLTFGALIERAHALAALLELRGMRGRPVLVLFGAGPDYLCALLACFAAGAIAVPAYPPRPSRLGRARERIAVIARNCGATLALTTQALALETLRFEGIELLGVDAH